MIDIKDKRQCCGCAACYSICPKKCISMNADDEGFLYPKVSLSECINCGLCEKVCPVIHQIKEDSNKPLAYACWHKDSAVIASSSSGGVFSALAEAVVASGGLVCGASFDRNWNVEHRFVDNIEQIYLLRGSKYVQSNVGEALKQVKKYLGERRPVMFVGTPCQIAGLNHYIGNKCDTLLTVEVICHSIPSPKVWADYLSYLISKTVPQGLKSRIHSVSFRSKLNGWNNYSLRVMGDIVDSQNEVVEANKVFICQGKNENLYMRGFLSDLYNRPSCTNCPARCHKSDCDITIGDFWRIEKYHPELADSKGISIMLLYSDRAIKWLNQIEDRINMFPVPYEEVEPYGVHTPLTRSSKDHPLRHFFFSLPKNIPINTRIYLCVRPVEILTGVKSFVKRVIK